MDGDMELTDARTDEGFTLELDEEGLVWLGAVLEDGEEIELCLGIKDEVCDIMCRFLAEVDYGDCR